MSETTVGVGHYVNIVNVEFLQSYISVDTKSSIIDKPFKLLVPVFATQMKLQHPISLWEIMESHYKVIYIPLVGSFSASVIFILQCWVKCSFNPTAQPDIGGGNLNFWLNLR